MIDEQGDNRWGYHGVEGCAGRSMIRETIWAMLEKEHRYCCLNYIKLSNDAGDEGAVARGISARARACRWMFDVVDRLPSLDREVAVVAAGLLDRYLSADSASASRRAARPDDDGDRSCHALAALTCLYVAVKLSAGRVIEAGAMCGLLDGSGTDRTPEELIRCETRVLSSLGWNLAGPTALQFVGYALELLPPAYQVREELAPALYAHCKLQAESAVEDYAMVGLNRSTIAVAAILNAMDLVRGHDLPLRQRIEYANELSSAFFMDLESPMMYEVRARLLHGLQNQARAEQGYGPYQALDGDPPGPIPVRVSAAEDLQPGVSELQAVDSLPSIASVTSDRDAASISGTSSDDFGMDIFDDDCDIFHNLEVFCNEV